MNVRGYQFFLDTNSLRELNSDVGVGRSDDDLKTVTIYNLTFIYDQDGTNLPLLILGNITGIIRCIWSAYISYKVKAVRLMWTLICLEVIFLSLSLFGVITAPLRSWSSTRLSPWLKTALLLVLGCDCAAHLVLGYLLWRGKKEENASGARV